MDSTDQDTFDFVQSDCSMPVEPRSELLAACIAAEDLMVRCDGTDRPATDDEWDAVLAQLRAVIGKAEAV